MNKKINIKVEFKETNNRDPETDRLLEILELNGYFDEFGRWHDPVK